MNEDNEKTENKLEDGQRSDAATCSACSSKDEALRAVWAAWTKGASLDYAVARVKHELGIK